MMLGEGRSPGFEADLNLWILRLKQKHGILTFLDPSRWAKIGNRLPSLTDKHTLSGFRICKHTCKHTKLWAIARKQKTVNQQWMLKYNLHCVMRSHNSQSSVRRLVPRSEASSRPGEPDSCRTAETAPLWQHFVH